MRYCDCLLHHHLGRENTQHSPVGIRAPGPGHRQHRIPVYCMRTAMVVTSPGGPIHTCSICSRVSIVIRGAEFRTGLIVIDSSGIDVILGMETLTRWGVRIDCAQRIVHLSASDGQEVTVSLQSLLGFFIRWRLDPWMVFAWCLNSRMSFRRTCQNKEEESLC